MKTLQKQTTNVSGLATSQALELLSEHGLNKIEIKKDDSVLLMFVDQLRSPLIYILIFSGIIILLLKEFTDAIVIFGVILINSLIGTFQELRARKSLNSLKNLIAPKAKVYRDSRLQIIDAELIVPGDYISIESGDRVPADGTLIESHNLQVNESQLTGESYPITKSVDDLNKVFMSTIVASGRATFVVNNTGIKTEIGKLSKAVIENTGRLTPLQKKLESLVKRIALGVLTTCSILFLYGFWQGMDLREIFKVSVSLAVSAIPEGLPVVVTVTLAIGVYNMSRKNAIIRNLSSASTLAGVDIICTDKTGTITEGKIILDQVYTLENNLPIKIDFENKALLTGVICNDASIDKGDKIGDLLDIAILDYALTKNVDVDLIKNSYKRIAEIPFDSLYKYQAVLNQNAEGKREIALKGAYEVVLDQCSFTDKKTKQQVLDLCNKFADDGNKVIVVASKEHVGKNISHSDIKDLELDGFFVFSDPLKEGVNSSVKYCIDSGIQVMMITGDSLNTAKSIASEAGIYKEHDLILEGKDIQNFDKIHNNLTVIARATPMEKLTLIDAFQKKSLIVAMTGDGVNDAPALTKADIGIAMGKNGTDAAREAADMILADDNFASIVSGIKEARRVFDNIRKVVAYLLSTSLGEILTIGIALILDLPLPLIAVQILWLNLVTDGLLDIAISTEPIEAVKSNGEGARRYKKNIIDSFVFKRTLFLSMIMAIGSISFYYVLLQTSSVEYARTGTLLVMAMFQWFNALNARSENQSVFSIGFFKNKAVIGTLVLEIFLCIGAIYTPFMQRLLETQSLSLSVWIYALLISVTIFVFEEVRKYVYRRMRYS